MIVGTAGHIDHGKTSLVRTITGVDTDRLKMEKVRGISIELGYAFLSIDANDALAFVDVPGHRSFMHHMVAGATGINFALLVVAADDGPMPQTVEHLQVLQLLDIHDAAIAMTKIDRCSAMRRRECEDEIRILVKPTPLAQAPVFPLSTVTREGVPALVRHLVDCASRHKSPRGIGAGFRLAVDRCFTLKGLGTTVTGTVFAGEVRPGDKVTITPKGIPTYVRSVHAQNRPAEVSRMGDRCGIVLAGVEKEKVDRGDWIVAPSLHVPCDRFDAYLRVLAIEPTVVKHWTLVHLHLGAVHMMARVSLLSAGTLSRGDEGLVQLVPERPIGALAGDRFIIRDTSAERTLGGGYVIDPFPPRRGIRTPVRLEALRLMQALDPSARLHSMLEKASQGIDLKRFATSCNVDTAGIVLPESAVRITNSKIDFAFDGAIWTRTGASFRASIFDYHHKYPNELGPDLGTIRRTYFPRMQEDVLACIAAELHAKGQLHRVGPWWHLAEHGVALTQREHELFERILIVVNGEDLGGAWVRDVAATLNGKEPDVRIALIQLARRGEVHQIVNDLFFARSAIDRLLSIAKEIAGDSKIIQLGEFRDRIRLGRKRAVQILEFFDRFGFTRRTGKGRVVL